MSTGDHHLGKPTCGKPYTYWPMPDDGFPLICGQDWSAKPPRYRLYLADVSSLVHTPVVTWVARKAGGGS